MGKFKAALLRIMNVSVNPPVEKFVYKRAIIVSFLGETFPRAL